MQPSIFNVRVPLADRDEVFLMNTFTDAQLIVSREVSDLLDRLGRDGFMPDVREREAFTTLAENGFIVESRATDHKNIEDFFTEFRSGQDQLRVTVLTTLQCNFACDYCIQGDHGEYNKTAAKMSMETAARVAEWIEGRMDGDRAEELRADVLRRRTAPESAGGLLPGRAAVAGVRAPRRQHGDEHHHQRPAAHAARSSIA